MRAAVLFEHGGTPRAAEFDDPRPTDEHVVVDVRAAGLHHLDLHKASGTFYMGPPPLPSVVGTDGVGVLGDGRRVFFDVTVAPYGSMAERALVPSAALLDVADGADDAVAAALGNTGLGAYLALAWRSSLQAGETVLVLGATGAVGGVAVQVAKLLGAGRVVAGAEITLPAPLIRSKSLDVRGFSVAHPPLDLRREAYLHITDLAGRGELVVDVEPVALDDVGGAWERQRQAAGGPKLVVVPTMKGRAGP